MRSFLVTRESSHAIRSAVFKIRTARGGKSSRFPIGVATTNKMDSSEVKFTLTILSIFESILEQFGINQPLFRNLQFEKLERLYQY